MTKYIVLLLVLISSTINLYSQCSDAGVCYLGGNLKKTASDITSSNLSFRYGLGITGSPEDATIHSFTFGTDLAFAKNFYVSAALPVYSLTYSANITSRNGLGDAFLLGNYVAPTGRNQNLIFHGGFKLPTSKIEPDKFGYLLAQGSTDVLVGADFNYSFFNISAGLQLPVSDYKSGDTITFKRGADFMFRAGYQRTAGDLKVRFELLGIKRLSKNQLIDHGITYDQEKSDFFQLNIVAGLAYRVSQDIGLDIKAAVPINKRDENYDFTKRAFTIDAGIKYFFNF